MIIDLTTFRVMNPIKLWLLGSGVAVEIVAKAKTTIEINILLAIFLQSTAKYGTLLSGQAFLMYIDLLVVH